MSPIMAIEHGCTSLLGVVILALIGCGTWHYGFDGLFTRPLGRLVMALAMLDAVGLALWT